MEGRQGGQVHLRDSADYVLAVDIYVDFSTMEQYRSKTWASGTEWLELLT